jgi:predicted lipoprotein with Yx(FWY)xxD motif
MIRKLALALALAAPAMALAQPADLPIPPATTSTYPPGVSVKQTPSGAVYAVKGGLVLYGMDMRTLLRWAPDPSQYCQGQCAETWEPLLAPADAKVNIAFPQGFGGGGRRALPEGFVNPQTAPDWTVIRGPQGPQWVYKGWHMVFTRRGAKAGDTSFDGTGDHTWNTLKFVPQKPAIVAPTGIAAVLAGGVWALADRDGRLLYTSACKAGCGAPLPAAMASRGMGEWRVDHGSDRPQWLWRGQPVYVAADGDPASIPAKAKVIRP